MNTVQIKYIVDSLHPLRGQFKGVIPIDMLNSQLFSTKHSSVIVNSAPSSHPGSHWFAILYVDDKQAEVFDSYGMIPNKNIIHHLEKCVDRISYSNIPVQEPFSHACGAHCIYYLFHRSKGSSMMEIVSRMNDHTVVDFVNSIFSPEGDDFDELMQDEKVVQHAVEMYKNML